MFVAIIAELIHPGSGFGLGQLWLLVAAIIWWPIWYGLVYRRYGAQRVAAFDTRNIEQGAKYRRWLFAYFMPIIALRRFGDRHAIDLPDSFPAAEWTTAIEFGDGARGFRGYRKGSRK
jgi:hypothetical protein